MIRGNHQILRKQGIFSLFVLQSIGANRLEALLAGLLLLAFGTPFARASAISQLPDTNTWGVDSIVFAVHRVGNVVYLGGDFTNLVSPNGVIRIPAPGLAALDINTGQPTNWRPITDTGTVFTITSSDDGSEIYVGGAFGRVNGSTRAHFACISTNGTLLWSC